MTDQNDDLMRKFSDAMRASVDRALLSGSSLNTASNEPQPQMTKIDLLAALRRLQESIEQSDPLLQRGIPKEYVCVVNPALVPVLKEEFDRTHSMIGMLQPSSFIALNWLSTLMGRATWQIPDAPTDRVEYMHPAEMRRRYASFFERMARAIHKERMLDARRAADRQREGGQGI